MRSARTLLSLRKSLMKTLALFAMMAASCATLAPAPQSLPPVVFEPVAPTVSPRIANVKSEMHCIEIVSMICLRGKFCEKTNYPYCVAYLAPMCSGVVGITEENATACASEISDTTCTSEFPESCSITFGVEPPPSTDFPEGKRL